MMGKKMESSGFGDVLLESGLISSGSLQGVLSGKNYSRATRCHKVLVEALHRLLMNEFKETNEGRQICDGLKSHHEKYLGHQLQNPNKEVLEALMDDVIVNAFVEKYLEFCDSVRNGVLGKTAVFWLSYMDHVSLILLLKRIWRQVFNCFIGITCFHWM